MFMSMTTPTTPKNPQVKVLPMRFYVTAGGRDVVREYLRTLPEQEQWVIGDELDRLEKWGTQAPGLKIENEPFGMYSLKPQVRSKQRVMFFILDGEVWVLYAFQKDDQKLLHRHRDAAKRRMDEIKGRK